MTQHIYPRDKALTIITLVFGAMIWFGAGAALVKLGGTKSVVGAISTLLLIAAIGFIAYIFSRSAAIAQLRGNGMELSEAQFPDLYAQFVECCDKLAINTHPALYVLNGNGVLNAFATWFLGKKHVVLLSNVVDAMEANPSGIRFYVGHELAHVIRHDNAIVWLVRWPALLFPLLGASFSRARESTCDLHGLACCQNREDAARSLLALAAGSKRWANTSLQGARAQVVSARGFWMSLHELTASYPWNIKRVVRVLDETPEIPRRSAWAYVFAAFVPYAGRLGAGIGLLLYVYVIGIVAAIAIPAYQTYTIRATLSAAMADSQAARSAIGHYYEANNQIPASLDAVGFGESGPKGISFNLAQKGMILTVHTLRGDLVFVPSKDELGHIIWGCRAGAGLQPAQLPPSCR